MENKNIGITQILSRWRDGDPEALDELAPLVMQDLRILAVHSLQGPEAHGIQATELVSEFYAIVADNKKKPADVWQSRKQFFAFAGTAMRNLMITTIRKQNSLKRGGDQLRVPLDDVLNRDHHPDEIMGIAEAVADLQKIDPLQGQIVDLVFFVGLTQEQAADALEIPVSKLRSQWGIAKMWLRRALTQDDLS